MQERQDANWDRILERSKMPLRHVDNRIVLGTIIVVGLGGFIGSTVALEFARGINEAYKELLSPPLSYALQFSATGLSAFLGIGIGFSFEKYLAEGEI